MLTKEEIIAALASVAGPDGKTPLPDSGALSDIMISDGRVVFLHHRRSGAIGSARRHAPCRGTRREVARRREHRAGHAHGGEAGASWPAFGTPERATGKSAGRPRCKPARRSWVSSA